MASSRRLLPSLPSELIEEVIYRTPAESLIRFKLTCKKWYALITDKKFTYNQMNHSPERFIKIDNYRDVHIMDPVTGTLSVSPIPDEFRVPNTIMNMVHCDGLMLCMCADWRCNTRTDHADLAVWNPVLREIKWIEPSVCYRNTDYFGIGYETTSRDNYKILRFLGFLGFLDDDESDPKCEIYETKSGSWKTLKTKLDWFVDMHCRGVSVKGNMYWIAVKKGRFIQSFDFSMETFKDICVCPPFKETQSLACFNGDRLSLLQQDEESVEIEVWVTNKLSDGVVSFSKYFNVTSPNLPVLQFHMARPCYSIGKKINIMAWCEGEVEEDGRWYTCITLYEIDEGGIRKQIETGRHGTFRYRDPFICSYVYVPSLIPVPE